MRASTTGVSDSLVYSVSSGSSRCCRAPTSVVVSATVLLVLFCTVIVTQLGRPRHYCATWVISNGTGFWAWCGCSSPRVDLQLGRAAGGRSSSWGACRGRPSRRPSRGSWPAARRRRWRADRPGSPSGGRPSSGQLGAGQGDLVGVDDDDEVTGVDVRREGRLVLAAQQDRGLADARRPSTTSVASMTCHVRVDLAGLRGVRAHGSSLRSLVMSLRRWWCVLPADRDRDLSGRHSHNDP